MKKLRVMILSMIMLMTMTSISNATQFSCKVGVTASKNKIKAGDTVTINFAINNLQLSDGSLGVTMLDGLLEYDTEIFEEVKKSDIECGENRTATFLSANKRVFVKFNNKDGIISKSGTTMFSITMKVKANAQFENTQVKLNNISITDNNQKVTINSIGILLQAEAQTTTDPIIPTDTVLNENVTKPSDRSETSNRKTDTTSNVTTSDIKKEVSEVKTITTIQQPNKEADKNVVDILNIGWLFNNDGTIKIDDIIVKSITVINGVAEVLISICM